MEEEFVREEFVREQFIELGNKLRYEIEQAIEDAFYESGQLKYYNEQLVNRNQELQAMIVKAKELLCLAMDNLNHGNVDFAMDNIDEAIDALGGL